MSGYVLQQRMGFVGGKEMTEMIPISEIDKLIKAAEDMDKTSLDTFIKRWTDFEVGSLTRAAVLSHLRGLEEKAIPSIPISKIDEKIKDFKAIAKYDPIEDPITKYIINVIIPELEGLKK